MDKIKGMFSTPKRAVITVLVMLLVLGILGTGIAVAAVYLDHKEEMIEYRIEQELSERLYGDDSVVRARLNPPKRAQLN